MVNLQKSGQFCGNLRSTVNVKDDRILILRSTVPLYHVQLQCKTKFKQNWHPLFSWQKYQNCVEVYLPLEMRKHITRLRVENVCLSFSAVHVGHLFVASWFPYCIWIHHLRLKCIVVHCELFWWHFYIKVLSSP